MDLALNAPGKSGIFFCDALAPFELQTLQKPKCNPRRVPARIQLGVTLGYLVHACAGQGWDDFKSYTWNQLKLQLASAPEFCGGSADNPCVPTVRFVCRENQAVPSLRRSFPQHAEALFTLSTGFSPELGLEHYAHAGRETRRRAGVHEGDVEVPTLTQKATWPVNDTELVYVDVSSWAGVCDDHPNTLGTKLDVSEELTCRGCSPSFTLNNGACEPCGYNMYTPGPFAAWCTRCPPEAAWEDRIKMIELCYIRR
ncbi:hypothetical protein EGW08_000265 [Elysia chlorotica]|uniref:Uncharacterized protein n=1 Tax=Elysia chlorotica TaxID=188477 RepID=A0A433UE63_ELYCH|nr:hypothetical protein EGW08_000265 [Elysia chlorotica]